MGSRGSIIPYFISIKNKGELPITDKRMTRFMISLEEGVNLVWEAMEDMVGGEIYVKKIPSMKVVDIAEEPIGNNIVELKAPIINIASLLEILCILTNFIIVSNNYV